MVSKQLIMDYKELLKSKMVLDATSKELNIPGVDANYLEGKVSLNGINSSNLIMLSAIDSSPVKARNIANTLANVFINKVKELTNEDNVGIVDLAETPTIQIATSAKKNIAMAFMIALLGTISMIYIFDQLDDTVRKPEWVEGEFKLKVLGMIPMKDIK